MRGMCIEKIRPLSPKRIKLTDGYLLLHGSFATKKSESDISKEFEFSLSLWGLKLAI